MRPKRQPLSSNSHSSDIKDQVNIVRRAFQEFLTVPTVIILLFILLALGMYYLERGAWQFQSPVRSFLEARIFADSGSTSSLLSTIAGSIITVTSLTITLLLLIVQQTASTLTGQVFDQFLRRRSNQIYFGYFIGLALYTLVTLATVDEPFNPVMAAALAFLLTVIALFLLILLFYSTIHQMRSQVIIHSIYDHTLEARDGIREILSRTRREPAAENGYSHSVESRFSGYVTGINLSRLDKALSSTDPACEVVLRVTIGSFVAYRDVLAEVSLKEPGDIEDLVEQIRLAVHLERSRNLQTDPAYGLQQLEVIAWSAASTAKSNLAPVFQTLFSLTDLLSRWTDDEDHAGHSDAELLPVVYQDNLIQTLVSAFESLAVVASLSSAHQVLVIIFDAFSRLLPRIKEEWQELLVDSLGRILPLVDQFLLTRTLEDALVSLINHLKEIGQLELASQYHEKLVELQNKT